MASAGSKRAIFRFYAELNDFLAPERRFTPFAHQFQLPASVKDMIESYGVPHTEVELILVNGTPVHFSIAIQHGDRITVYPAFRSLDVHQLQHLRPPPPGHRFVLDTHLGRLARYMRMLGFDVSYENNCEDEELSRISHDQSRILLTRDTGLLKRSAVVYGYFVRATAPKQQVVEVLRRYELFSSASPFSRCLRCNALLNPVAKETVVEQLQSKTRRHYEEFRTCPTCNRIYWAGSHYTHMRGFVEQLLDSAIQRDL